MLLNNERIRRCLTSGLRMHPILLAEVTINDDAHCRLAVLAVKYCALSPSLSFNRIAVLHKTHPSQSPTCLHLATPLRCFCCRVPPSHCAIHINPSFDHSIATDIAL